MKAWTKRLTIVAISALIAGFTAPAGAGDDAPSGRVTFYKDVLPVLQQNCQICHRPGGDNIAGMVAPMSLVTYREVRPWAKAIATNVQARKMPPWFASTQTHGIFENERTLTGGEIATLVKWASTGAVTGNPGDAPEPLTFEDTGGWQAGQPDLIIQIPEEYPVPDEADDHYVSFQTLITEDQLPADRWLRSVEWMSGSEVVHHIVGSATARLPDGRMQRDGLGSTAPGEEPMIFPEGYAKKLYAGSTINFSMHYHKEPGPGTSVLDRSSVGFRFWKADDPPIRHEVFRNGIGGSYEIPPYHPNWQVGASRTFAEDTTIISLHPHMHLRGKDARYVAFYPDGTVEELLYVPRWDFNWQTDYLYAEPKRLPAGTRVEFTVHYDNSTANPSNPDPSVAMGFGGRTTDEMMIGFINYTNTAPSVLDQEPGDSGTE